MKIYTDGSFNRKMSKGSSAYAAVIITDETHTDYVVDILYGVITDKEYTDMWNVGGEIWGVLAGVDYAVHTYNPSDITIYHDYIGLSKWVSGEWKTKNNTTSSYRHYIKNIKHERLVRFIKVAGHSNDLLNDLADQYANKGTENYLSTGKMSTLITGMRISKR